MLTVEFFTLHTLNPIDMELWEHMNLKGFFKLPTWGPDYMRDYQTLTTLMQENNFTVMGLDGELNILQMTQGLIRESLNLPSRKSTDCFKLHHTDEENRVCSNSNKLVWDELNRQCIRLALQLHMQHFHITFPHGWFMPKLTIAI